MRKNVFAKDTRSFVIQSGSLVKALSIRSTGLSLRIFRQTSCLKFPGRNRCEDPGDLRGSVFGKSVWAKEDTSFSAASHPSAAHKGRA